MPVNRAHSGKLGFCLYRPAPRNPEAPVKNLIFCQRFSHTDQILSTEIRSKPSRIPVRETRLPTKCRQGFVISNRHSLPPATRRKGKGLPCRSIPVSSLREPLDIFNNAPGNSVSSGLPYLNGSSHSLHRHCPADCTRRQSLSPALILSMYIAWSGRIPEYDP